MEIHDFPIQFDSLKIDSLWTNKTEVKVSSWSKPDKIDCGSVCCADVYIKFYNLVNLSLNAPSKVLVKSNVFKTEEAYTNTTVDSLQLSDSTHTFNFRIIKNLLIRLSTTRYRSIMSFFKTVKVLKLCVLKFIVLLMTALTNT